MKTLIILLVVFVFSGCLFESSKDKKTNPEGTIAVPSTVPVDPGIPIAVDTSPARSGTPNPVDTTVTDPKMRRMRERPKLPNAVLDTMQIQ